MLTQKSFIVFKYRWKTRFEIEKTFKISLNFLCVIFMPVKIIAIQDY
jgi:hypothetical protein